jgi:putative lipoprotein
MTHRVPLVAALCIAASLCACGSGASGEGDAAESRPRETEGPRENETGGAPAPAPARFARAYDCDDGFYLVAEFRPEDDTVYLFLGERGAILPHVPSGSGAKYDDPGAGVTFWEKGGEAMLLSGGVERSCVENRRRSIVESVKLRGADFWGTGNEPGWSVEVYPDRVVWIGDYGQTRHEARVEAPEVDPTGRTAIYAGTSDGHELVVILEGEPCVDSMSGESFESSVEVRVDARVLRGCGQPLH